MKVMCQFERDEILQQIPYMVVCEAHEGARWNTGRRRRLWAQQFTKAEQIACSRLFRQAKSWTLVRGCPNQLTMTMDTFRLWRKLADFCASI